MLGFVRESARYTVQVGQEEGGVQKKALLMKVKKGNLRDACVSPPGLIAVLPAEQIADGIDGDFTMETLRTRPQGPCRSWHGFAPAPHLATAWRQTHGSRVLACVCVSN